MTVFAAGRVSLLCCIGQARENAALLDRARFPTELPQFLALPLENAQVLDAVTIPRSSDIEATLAYFHGC